MPIVNVLCIIKKFYLILPHCALSSSSPVRFLVSPNDLLGATHCADWRTRARLTEFLSPEPGSGTALSFDRFRSCATKPFSPTKDGRRVQCYQLQLSSRPCRFINTSPRQWLRCEDTGRHQCMVHIIHHYITTCDLRSMCAVPSTSFEEWLQANT